MIDLASARAEILDAISTLAAETMSVQALASEARPGPRTLLADVVSAHSVPPFANSAMDGYAVRAADTASAREEAPIELRVVGELPAGRAPTTLVGDGEAIRIMTGAPMPDGADAIVMVERTTRAGDDAVLIHHAATSGDHVRGTGGDVHAGEVVLAAGARLGPAAIGVLAGIGCQEVLVSARARVGVLSTGDELVAGTEPLKPGQIRDSNRPMLLALANEAGCDAIDLGVLPDDEAVLEAALLDASKNCDAIVTSGGVSVGDYDVVKAVLGRIAAMQWWQVAIKPAKPLAFGSLNGVPIFGLPGNPVSSLVSFELFARPALQQMMGHVHRFRPVVVARAAHDFNRRVDAKLHLDRVELTCVDGRYVATTVGRQASNALAASATANGLALIEDGPGVGAGAEIRVMRLDAPCDH